MGHSYGIIERVQVTLQKALGFNLQQYKDDWDVPLQSIGHALNYTPNKSTGFLANLLMFGREVGKVVDGSLKIPPHSRKSLREQLKELMIMTEACRKVANRHFELQRERYHNTVNKMQGSILSSWDRKYSCIYTGCDVDSPKL